MLNRKQRLTLLTARKRQGCLFSQLPCELIHVICSSAQDETEFNTALHHAAFGELEPLQHILEKAKKDKVLLKEYLLNRGHTTTRGGVRVKHTTLLECAVLGGDPELIAMIKPYFSEIKGGDEEMEKQLARCRPCINGIMEKQPQDLTWLFDIIKQASDQDVAEELKTGEHYDKAYQSDLRNALNQWRQAKLNSADRVINVLKAPRMHCNYQNWIHVNAFLDDEWNKNKWKDLVKGSNYDKVYLILRQLRGFIELLELPAVERFAFARGEVENPPAKLDRSLEYKYRDNEEAHERFPDFDSSCIASHSGPGFDSYVSLYGGAWGMGAGVHACAERFQTYVEQKQQTCRTYAATSKTETVWMCDSLK